MMNNRQANQLDMFRNVHKHGKDNEVIAATVPAFFNNINLLGQKIIAIESISGRQSERLGGVAEDKRNLRLKLCDITYATIAPVKAYALSIGDNTLRDKMDYSLSDLRKINDDTLAGIASNLHGLVVPLLPSLADYGITSAATDAWQLAIDAYSPVVAGPQAALANKRTLTLTLKQLFSEANVICNDLLDPLAVPFKVPQPGFYTTYLHVRQIKDMGTGSTRIKGFVDDENGRSLLDAVVTIQETGESVRTDIDGVFLFPGATQGTYTVKVEKPGFTSVTSEPFVLKRGQTANVELSLKTSAMS